MGVRLAPEWLSQGDERILEFLEEEVKSSPNEIANSDKIRLSRSHINTRLSKLRNANLVSRTSPGLYTLAEKGEKYLKGAADLRNEPEPR